MRLQRSVPSEIDYNCNDVQIEPELQEITTEVIPEQSASTNNGARLPVVYGEADVRGQWWMSGSSTLLLLQIATPSLTTATPSISVRRDMLSEKRHGPHTAVLCFLSAPRP